MKCAKFQPFSNSFGMGACILALVFIGSLFIIASGGGDGDSRTAPTESATLTSTDQGVAAATDAVMQSVDMAGPSAVMDSGSFGVSTDAQAISSPLRSIVDNAFDVTRGIAAHAAGRATPLAIEECDNYNGSTGYIDTGDFSLDDFLSGGGLSATISYRNCVMGTETLNGSQTVTVNGDFTTMTYKTGSFTYQNTVTNENMTMTDYEMRIAVTATDSEGDMTAGSITIRNGTVSGTVDSVAINSSFFDFIYAFREITGGEALSLNGMMNTDCIGGWVTVTTLTEFELPDASDCPTAGKVSIESGSDTITAEVDSVSGDIDIYFGATLVLNDEPCISIEGSCFN